MTLVTILGAAATTVVLSEVLGRGRVIYTRLITVLAVYAVVCGVAGWVAVARGGSVEAGAAITLSVAPLIAAWLGFRIHLSNSITLEVVDVLATGPARTLQQVAIAYDVDRHTARRVAILQAAGYLKPSPGAGVTDTAKTRAVLLLIRLLCGPLGPRAVASRLPRQIPPPA